MSNSRPTPPDAMTESQLLEQLLHYCETNPQEKAKILIAKHGNLANLLDVPLSELITDQVLTESGVKLLQLVSELYRRYLLIRSHGESHLMDRRAVIDFLTPLFAQATAETIYLLSLDESKRLLGCSQLSRGSVNSVQLPIRALIKEALLKQATYVILAHNHLSDFRTPSKEDLDTTYSLRDLLLPMDIQLLDHIIFAKSGYCSLTESGLYIP